MDASYMDLGNTMNRNVVIVSVLTFVAACAGQPDYRQIEAVPQTVSKVDLDRYMGRWHEVARYPNSFEKGCLDTLAEYTLKQDGSVSVVNSCTLADGKTKRAEGRARVVDGSNGARLKVRFAPAWIPFAEGDYWIFHLEPDYSAALVGDPDGKYLWILARSPQPEQAVLVRVLAKAEALGFETAPLEYAGTVSSEDL